MLITMTETRRGPEDGFVVKRFHKGCKYTVSDSLAIYFMQQGWAYNSDPDDDEMESDVVELISHQNKIASSSVVEAMARANMDFTKIFGSK